MSRVRANSITNKDATGAPSFTHGATVTGIVTATSFTGNVTGNVTGNLTGAATRVTVTDQSADTSCNVLYTQAPTGDLTPHSGTNLTFNSSSGALTATSFVGSLTGNATGTAAGLSGTPQLNVGVTTATNIKITGTSESTIHTQAASAGGNTSPAYQTADNFIITMGGNTTMTANNQKIGQTGAIFMVQDGTGSRTAAWHADYKWAGGTAPTLSTAANSIDRIDYFVKASNQIHAVASLDVK